MQPKTRLEFKGSEVRKLIDDSKKATERIIPYEGVNKKVPVGLILVKDDGVYLLSNAKSDVVPSKSGLISYAKGYGSLDSVPEKRRDEHYEKIRDAVGGDDFAEAVPVNGLLDRMIQDGMNFIIYLSEDKISFQVRAA